jgi:hypothetical protein
VWFDCLYDVFFDWFVVGGVVGFLIYFLMFVVFIYMLWWKCKYYFSVFECVVFIGMFVGYFIYNVFVFDNFMSYIVFQITVNIGMNIGLVPVAGIALPFISYGGSSLMALFMGMAFLP